MELHGFLCAGQMADSVWRSVGERFESSGGGLMAGAYGTGNEHGRIFIKAILNAQSNGDEILRPTGWFLTEMGLLHGNGSVIQL